MMTDQSREHAIAEALCAWFRARHSAQLDPTGSYKGWVSDFGYTLVDGRSFSLDLSDSRQWWPLLLLAVGWSYSGQWENSAAFLGVLAELDFLDYSKWQPGTQDHIDQRLAQAKAHLEQRLATLDRAATFPFEWLPGRTPPSRKRVFFPSSWRYGMRRAVEIWPQVSRLLSETCDGSISGADFFQAMMEDPYLAGLSGISGRENRRMIVKLPFLLRELRAQGAEGIEGAYCSIPDQRVKDMRQTLGLPNGALTSCYGLSRATRRLWEDFGDLYDLPLFAFWDYCNGNAEADPTLKFSGCHGCPLTAHCKTYPQRTAC